MDARSSEAEAAETVANYLDDFVQNSCASAMHMDSDTFPAGPSNAWLCASCAHSSLAAAMNKGSDSLKKLVAC